MNLINIFITNNTSFSLLNSGYQLATIFSSEKIIRGLGSIPNKQATLPRTWLAKPMLAQTTILSNIFRRKRSGMYERTKPKTQP